MNTYSSRWNFCPSQERLCFSYNKARCSQRQAQRRGWKELVYRAHTMCCKSVIQAQPCRSLGRKGRRGVKQSGECQSTTRPQHASWLVGAAARGKSPRRFLQPTQNTSSIRVLKESENKQQDYLGPFILPHLGICPGDRKNCKRREAVRKRTRGKAGLQLYLCHQPG